MSLVLMDFTVGSIPAVLLAYPITWLLVGRANGKLIHLPGLYHLLAIAVAVVLTGLVRFIIDFGESPDMDQSGLGAFLGLALPVITSAGIVYVLKRASLKQ